MKIYPLINSEVLISTVVSLLSLAEYKIVYDYQYENANKRRENFMLSLAFTYGARLRFILISKSGC